MKNSMKVLVSAASVMVVGLTLVIGNGLLSFTAFAEPSSDHSATLDVSDIAAPDSDTLMQYVQDGDSYETVIKTTADANANPVFVEGQPGEGDMSQQAALDSARTTLVEKYALTSETLDRFTVTAKLNVVDAANPVWQVIYTPTDNNDFASIGSYQVLINSKTGEVTKTTSAADAVG